ncbi:unnamed protein product [Cunninghamella blakesleeana]
MHNKLLNHSEYIDESLKKVVALISKDIGFEAIDKAALISLTNILGSYLETLLLSTHSYAEIGNRIRPNYHDIQQAVKHAGINLLAFEQYANQYRIDHHNNKHLLDELNVLKLEQSNETTIEPIPDFLASDDDEEDDEMNKEKEDKEDKDSVDETQPDTSYVPAHLPKFPSKHSFRQTPVYIDRPENQMQVREMNSQQSRTVEENLKRLMSMESELLRQSELSARGKDSVLGSLKITPIVNYETALQRRKRAKKGKLE